MNIFLNIHLLLRDPFRVKWYNQISFLFNTKLKEATEAISFDSDPDNLGRPSESVSCGCYNKWPQIGWVKTIRFFSLTLEVRCLESAFLGWSHGVQGLWSPGGSGGQFIVFFCSIKVVCFLGLVAVSSHFLPPWLHGLFLQVPHFPLSPYSNV